MPHDSGGDPRKSKVATMFWADEIRQNVNGSPHGAGDYWRRAA